MTNHVVSWLQFFCCKYNDNSANITIFANKFSENRPIDFIDGKV